MKLVESELNKEYWRALPNLHIFVVHFSPIKLFSGKTQKHKKIYIQQSQHKLFNYIN